MARIEVPERLRPNLGLEVKMDVHFCDVCLSDGRVVEDLTVRGGWCITGHSHAPNGESELTFTAEDIVDVRNAMRRPWRRILRIKKW